MHSTTAITADRYEILWEEIAEFGLDVLASESERIIVEHCDGRTDVVEVASISDVNERWHALHIVSVLESVTLTHWTDDERIAVVCVDSSDAVYLVDESVTR